MLSFDAIIIVGRVRKVARSGY